MTDGITVIPKNTPVIDEDSSVEAEAEATLPVSEADVALQKMEVAQQLGVKDVADRKFEFIYEWLSKEHPAKGDLLQAMRQLETQLGLPRYGHGETRLSVLYSYLKAQHVLDQAIKVKNSYLL